MTAPRREVLSGGRLCFLTSPRRRGLWHTKGAPQKPPARAGIQLIPAHEPTARWDVGCTAVRCRAVRVPNSPPQQKIPSRLAWDLWLPKGAQQPLPGRAGIRLIPAHEPTARWDVGCTAVRCRAVRVPNSPPQQKIPSRLAWDLWLPKGAQQPLPGRAGIRLIPAHEPTARWDVGCTAVRCRAVRVPNSPPK